jgi:hypothetical protein
MEDDAFAAAYASATAEEWRQAGLEVDPALRALAGRRTTELQPARRKAA